MKKLKKIFVNPKYSGLRGMIADTEALEKILKAPGVKRIDGRNVVVSVPVEGEKYKLIMKHYRHRGGLKITGDKFISTGNRGLEEYLRLNQLADMSLNVPEAVGAITYKSGFFVKTRLFMKEVENAKTLKEFLSLKQPSGEKSKVMVLLGKYVENMHAKGVSHNNLTPDKVLVGEEKGKKKLYVLGWEDAEIKKELSEREKRKDRDVFYESFLKHMDLPSRKLVEYFSSFRKGYNKEGIK